MNLISLLVTILILALIAGVVWWTLNQITLPPPVRMIVNVALGIICILVLLGMVVGGVPVVRLG